MVCGRAHRREVWATTQPNLDKRVGDHTTHTARVGRRVGLPRLSLGLTRPAPTKVGETCHVTDNDRVKGKESGAPRLHAHSSSPSCNRAYCGYSQTKRVLVECGRCIRLRLGPGCLNGGAIGGDRALIGAACQRWPCAHALPKGVVGMGAAQSAPRVWRCCCFRATAHPRKCGGLTPPVTTPHTACTHQSRIIGMTRL
jgi:hypothetical protein